MKTMYHVVLKATSNQCNDSQQNMYLIKVSLRRIRGMNMLPKSPLFLYSVTFKDEMCATFYRAIELISA